MPRPKAVVFDLGKVLVDFDYGRAARNLAAHSKLSAAEIRVAVDQSPLLLEYETGLMTSEQFFNQVRDAIGYTGTPEAFPGLFADIFTPISAMIALHDELVGQRVPTFAFSNTNELAIRFVRRVYPFFNRFDSHILSYEEGAMKPSPRIYEAVERRTWSKGHDLIYIDDRPENIEEGLRRGWQAILHVDPAATISGVRKTLTL
jgi:glucose-1-phosphatase